MNEFLQDTPIEGQVLCPLCWPAADPREYAFAPCSEHGAARQAPAPDDARFREDPFYGNGGADADAATCRAFQALISRKDGRCTKCGCDPRIACESCRAGTCGTCGRS